MGLKLLVSGSLNYDMTFYVERFAPPKSVIKEIKEFLGGSGGNAAVAAARIMGRGKVAFFGAVGDDDIGLKHLRGLEEEGLVVDLVHVIKGSRSGRAYVFVRADGATAIYSYYGANHMLRQEDVNVRVLRALEEVDGVLVMNPPLEVARKLLKEAKEMGKLTFWDPGALAYAGVEKLGDLIARVDYILPNESELFLMTRTRNTLEAVEVLRMYSPEITVISKRGNEGAILASPEGRVVVISGIPLEEIGLRVVSTVGCGDTFSGVFSALTVMGYSLEESLKLANCAAAINATREEARGSPKYGELMEWCRKYSKYLELSVRKIR